MEETGITRPLRLCEVCGEPATESIEGFAFCSHHKRVVWVWIGHKLAGWSVYHTIDVAVWSLRQWRERDERSRQGAPPSKGGTDG